MGGQLFGMVIGQGGASTMINALVGVIEELAARADLLVGPLLLQRVAEPVIESLFMTGPQGFVGLHVAEHEGLHRAGLLAGRLDGAVGHLDLP